MNDIQFITTIEPSKHDYTFKLHPKFLALLKFFLTEGMLSVKVTFIQIIPFINSDIDFLYNMPIIQKTAKYTNLTITTVILLTWSSKGDCPGGVNALKRKELNPFRVRPRTSSVEWKILEKNISNANLMCYMKQKQSNVFTLIRVYKNQNRACCETNQLISGNIDMFELPVDHFNLSQR